MRRVTKQSDSNNDGVLQKHEFRTFFTTMLKSVAHEAEKELTQSAAEDYEAQLQKISKEVLPRNRYDLPIFDMLLLGFGEDGHICSLFPGRQHIDNDTGHWILPVTDSPKPPSRRITFSLFAVNSAKQVVLVGTGIGKKEIVQTAFQPRSKLPCRRAFGCDPAKTRPTWILDKAAAELLPAGTSEEFEVHVVK
jgi:6-phosphogluconolactonase